jgi:hypothetical protein
VLLHCQQLLRTLNDEKASDAISKFATSTRSKNSMKWSLYSSALQYDSSNGSSSSEHERVADLKVVQPDAPPLQCLSWCVTGLHHLS